MAHPPHQDRPPPRWRFSIRGLMAFIAVIALVVWAGDWLLTRHRQERALHTLRLRVELQHGEPTIKEAVEGVVRAGVAQEATAELMRRPDNQTARLALRTLDRYAIPMIAEAVQRGQDEAWLSELLAEMQADSATPVLDGWCREMNRASRLTIDPDTVASRPQLRSPGPTDWGALLDGLTNVVGAQLRHPGAAKRWCNAAADYPDPRVRIQVLAALVRQLESATQGGSNSSLDHSMVRDLLLGRLAGDADPMVRAGAAQGLAKLTKSDMALEALRAALHDVHAYVRLFSAESLHDLQETDGLDADLKGAIVSALTSELESLDLPWRLRAARLVVSLDARRFPAVWPALEEGITVTEDATSLQIIEWAGEQGPAAEPAIGILVQATRMAADQRKLTVLPMLDALPKIGGPLQDRRVEELLLDLAADERFPWRRHAVVSLKVFARASPRTVAGLMTALRDRSPVVRQAAAEALAEAGPDAGPVLRQALNDEEAAVQDTARESLRRLGTAP